MFTGEFHHAVDEKGRVAVPSRFRAELAGGGWLSLWIDGCLALHTRAGWEAFATKVGSLRIGDPNARGFQRRMFASAFEVALDRQGRLVVPAVLRDEAGLEGEVVVVGSWDHLELWSPTRWKAYSAELADPVVLAEHIQGLSI